MPSEPSSPPTSPWPSRWHRLNRALEGPRGRRIAGLLIALIFLALGASYLRKVHKGKSALIRWLPQIQDLRKGENIYVPHMYEMYGLADRDAHPVPPHAAFRHLPPPDGYTFPHPPFATLQLYPFSYFPDLVAGAIWYLLKVVAFLLALKMIFTIVAERGAPFTPLAALVVFILCLRTTQSDLNHGNINLFILFWTTVAFWAFKLQRDALAGLALAVGISLKVTPGLILVYFLYKRAWRAALWTGAGLVLCNAVIPSLVFGPENTWTYSYTWFKSMVEPHMIEGQIDTSFINQSIQGVLARYLSDVPTKVEHARSLLDLSPPTTRIVIRIVLLGLLAVLAWTCRRPRQPRDSFFLSIEYGLVLITMLYFNERTWKHHYVLMALPFAVWVYALQLAYLTRSTGWIPVRRWTIALGVSGALVLLTSKDILGHWRSDIFEYYGGIFFSSFIIYAGLIALARRARRCDDAGLTEHLDFPPTRPTPDTETS